MKCDLCNAKIEMTFLRKPLGSYIKDSKHKKRVICPSCQKTKTAEQIRTELG